MKARWLTDKYISLMLLVFPLWTGLEGYADITRSKFLFFAVLSGLYLAGTAVCMALDKTAPKRPNALQCFALAFMAAACLSAALSPYGRAVILGASRYDGLLTLLLYGGIFLGVSAFGEWKKYYVYLLAASASICSLVAIPQLLGENPFGLYPGDLTYFDANVRYTGDFLGTIGNTNLLAAFYCLCIPLFIWHALTHRALRDRLVLAAAALCKTFAACAICERGLWKRFTYTRKAERVPNVTPLSGVLISMPATTHTAAYAKYEMKVIAGCIMPESACERKVLFWS